MRSTMKKISAPNRALCLALCLLSLAWTAQSASGDPSSLILGMVSVTTNRLNPLIPVEREFMSLTALVYESLV